MPRPNEPALFGELGERTRQTRPIPLSYKEAIAIASPREGHPRCPERARGPQRLIRFAPASHLRAGAAFLGPTVLPTRTDARRTQAP